MAMKKVVKEKHNHREKIAPKKTVAIIVVKIEGEKKDKGRTWLHLEVYAFIALEGKMEPKFAGNS